MTITEENAIQLVAVATAAAMSVLHNREDAEDAAQDAMITLLERERAGTIASRFVAFSVIKTIATHRALNHLNKEVRRKAIERDHGREINRALSGGEVADAGPDEILISEEMHSRFESLSPLVYTTAHSHYLEGISVSALAKDYGCTEDVIYKRLQRARDTLTGEQNE